MARKAEFIFVGDAKSVIRAASQADKAVTGLAKTTDTQHAKMRASATQTGAAIKKFALGVGAVGALGVGYAVKAAAGFEKQLSSLGAVADATGAQMNLLRKQALKAGADTAYSAKQAAEAQTELAKGGLTATQILKGGLNAALGLAAAGELELADAAAVTARSMNLFGLQGDRATHIADALATAANRTTADVADFGIALAQGGAVAKSVGLSFDQTVVALEALAATGVKGSDAGTSLKTALIQMVKPTAKQRETMQKLGLSFKDSEGNMKSLGDISAMLRDKLGDQTKTQRTATLATLAGTDGVRTLTSLYDAGPAKIAAYEKGLAKQGTAAEVAAKKQDNLAGKLEQLRGSAETLAISIGSALIPPLTSAAKAATSFINQMQTGEGAGGKFRDVIMGIVNPIRDVVKGFKDGKVWAVALVAGLAGLAAGAVTIRTLVAVTRAWTAAQFALNLALTANPIGIVITAVAALSAAFVVAYTKSATFRRIASAAFAALRTVAASTFDIITFGMRQFLTGIGKVAGAASHLPGMGWLKGVSKAALAAAAQLSKISAAIRGVPDKKTIKIAVAIEGAKLSRGLLDALTGGGGTLTLKAPATLRRQGGGVVPGQGRGDRVPALLEPGEFVMRRKVVERFGPTFFAGLNGGMGDQTQRFTSGGIVSRANYLDRLRIPYLYGGGHGTATGFNKRGMDCSASVSYALGVSPRVSGQFMSFGKPGAGNPNDTKIFANPSHVFAVFNGRGWGTSRENPGGGPGWLSYNYRPGFTIRHLSDSGGSRSGRGDPQEANERGALQARLDENLDRLDVLRNRLARVPRGKAHARQRRSLQSQIRGLVSANRGIRGDLRNAPTTADITAAQEKAGSRLFNRVAAPFTKGIAAATRTAADLSLDIESRGIRYGQLERLFGQTDEDLTTVSGKKQRLTELAILKQEKVKMLKEEQKRVVALQRAIKKIEALLKAEGKARDRSRGAKRAKIVARMQTYKDRLVDLKAEYRTITQETIPDTILDIGDLDQSMREVASTQAEPGPTVSDKLSQVASDIDLQVRAGLLTEAQGQGLKTAAMQIALAQPGLTDRERWQIMGDLREAQQQAAEAIVDNTSALRDLQVEIARQNALAESIMGVSLKEAWAAMADVISGQIVGRDLNARALTAGTGTLARY